MRPELWELLAEIVAAVGLYAYLLRLAGVRPAAVSLLTACHAMALFCCVPVSFELAVAGTFALGACAYAVLAIACPWRRALVIALCFVTLVLYARPDPAVLVLLIALPLAVWTGLMVIIRDWARGVP